jgi:hypothetical protein
VCGVVSGTVNWMAGFRQSTSWACIPVASMAAAVYQHPLLHFTVQPESGVSQTFVEARETLLLVDVVHVLEVGLLAVPLGSLEGRANVSGNSPSEAEGTWNAVRVWSRGMVMGRWKNSATYLRATRVSAEEEGPKGRGSEGRAKGTQL